MTTKEAIQAMLDGKKVRKPSWVEGDYFMFDGECFIAEDTTIVMADFNGNDWEIYEEPKPKQTVTIEKWLVTNKKRFDVVETSDIDAHIGEGFSWTKVKLLDTYEVEI